MQQSRTAVRLTTMTSKPGVRDVAYRMAESEVLTPGCSRGPSNPPGEGARREVQGGTAHESVHVEHGGTQ